MFSLPQEKGNPLLPCYIKDTHPICNGKEVPKWAAILFVWFGCDDVNQSNPLGCKFLRNMCELNAHAIEHPNMHWMPLKDVKTTNTMPVRESYVARLRAKKMAEEATQRDADIPALENYLRGVLEQLLDRNVRKWTFMYDHDATFHMIRCFANNTLLGSYRPVMRAETFKNDIATYTHVIERTMTQNELAVEIKEVGETTYIYASVTE